VSREKLKEMINSVVATLKANGKSDKDLMKVIHDSTLYR
jgi:hypothetical protein